MNERDFIIDMVDEGRLDSRLALTMCLKFMALDEVKDMININWLDSDLAEWRKLNQEAA